MNILILGATGFIGNSLFLSLVSKHTITIASRNPIEGYTNWKKIDFSKQNNWKDLINDIDMVINCIGIIEGDFDSIQTNAPISLYKECINKNISIIHISAIGAEVEKPTSKFLQSKKMTDDYLLHYSKAKVIYPGIVIGKNGKSAQFLAEISQFPVVPIIKINTIPFLHITQLTDLIQQIITDFNKYPQQIFVFSKLEPLEKILESIKGERIKTITSPISIFKLFFTLFPKISIGIFNKTTFELSQQNLTEKHQAIFLETSKLLKAHTIKESDEFIKIFALLSVSFIWVWSGISSLISWETSIDLMQNISSNKQLAQIAIFSGSIIDILLGITVLSKKLKIPSLKIQIVVMLSYMILLSIFAPEFWLHPFGILSKNISLFALSYYLLKSE